MTNRFSVIFKTLGALWVLLAGSMLLPVLSGLWYKDAGVEPMLISAGVTACIGALVYGVFRGTDQQIKKRSAFLLVTATWLSGTIFGALPFYLSGFSRASSMLGLSLLLVLRQLVPPF